MTYCTNFNTIISSDSRARGIAIGIVNELLPFVENFPYDRMREIALDIVDRMLEDAFPVGGPFKTLTNGDIANAVLFKVWPLIVDFAESSGFKIELEITDFGEGENLRRCWNISLIPLTTDEQGSEQDPEQDPPENPFDPPDLSDPGEEEPPDPPEETPPDRQPSPGEQPRPGMPPSIPPRQPPPTPPTPPSTPPERQPPPEGEPDREERGDSEREDDEGEGEDEDNGSGGGSVPLPSPGEVGEFDDSEIVELLRQIRDNITRQGELDRKQAGELNQDLIRELNEIDDLLSELDDSILEIVTSTISDTTETVLDILESIVIENEVTVEIVTEAVNAAINLEPIVTAIREHGEAVIENATDGFTRLITAIDTGLGNANVALGDLLTGLREELESDFERLVKQSEENFGSWTQYITGLVTFEDEKEIADWVCRMLKFYRDLFQSCDFVREKSN